MLWLNNLYEIMHALFATACDLQLFQLLLVFFIGLFSGGIVNSFVYYFPLILKKRWHKECCHYLNYSDEINISTARFLSLLTVYCSHCDRFNCSSKVPLFSWLICGGRCGQCQRRLVCFFPVVEFFTALMTVLVYYRFDDLFILIPALMAFYLLLSLMFIDFYNLLLPDELTLLLLWLGIIFNLNYTFIAVNDAILGAVIGYLSLWSFYWLVRLVTGVHGLGYGDFKLLAALGAWFGWQVLHEIIFLSSVTALLGVAVVYLYKGKAILNQPIPFGSYLALAGLIMLIEPGLFKLLY